MSGVRLTGTINTTDISDVFPTHSDQLGLGGYRSVADITARDAIPTDRLSVGCWVHVQSDDKVYQYVGPSSWTERAFGTSLSSTKFTEFSHKTGNYTITYADNGKTFTNLGATSQVIFTLPAATADGYNFGFLIDGYQGILIQATSGDNISIGGISTDDDGYIQSFTPNRAIRLVSYDTETWYDYSNAVPFRNTIDNTMVRDSAGNSVWGRAENSTGDPADIIASADGYVLRRSGTTIGFGEVAQSAISGLTATLAGKVSGPAGATDNAIARFDSTSGGIIQNSSVTISDIGEISGVRETVTNYTTSVALNSAQSGSIISNKDATAFITFTLPTPAIGLYYKFHVDGYQGFRINVAASGQYIMIDGYESTTYVDTYQPNDFIYLFAQDTLGWQGTFSGTQRGNKGDITISQSGLGYNHTINNDAVTFAKMQNSAAAGLSVIGRPTNSAGDFSEIVADTDGYYLRRNGTTIEFGPLPAAPVDSVFGRTGVVVAATNDYTWAQIDKTTSSIADITTRSHTALTDIGTNSHSTIDSHIASTSNPHSVTASQVGNTTAQWNADKLRGVNIDATAPTTNQVLQYNGTDWIPATFSGGLSSTLNSANIFVGNGSNIATGVAVSGDISIDNAGLTAISSGVIVNADINASAAIDLTKIASASPGYAVITGALSLITSTTTSVEISYLGGVTSAIQTQINGKEPTIAAGTTGQYWRGDKSWQTLDKSAVGLSNVDNTSDANKPVSTATQTALDLKENLAITVEAKTANYSVLSSDNKRVFTNAANPSVDVVFSLPTCAAGLQFTFVKDCDKILTITAAASDAIVYHQQSTALAGSIVLDNVGDSVILVAGDDDLWYAQPFDEKIRLAENEIFIGSSLGFAEGQTMSGDVTLSVTGTAVISANAVLLGKLAASSAGCVLIGRSANSTGDYADIAATENGQSLYRTGGILAFSHGVGQGTNTSDADCVVDANLYDVFSWNFTSGSGTARNLQIDNLVAGRKVRIFVKNDSGSNAATISLIASTTTSSHSNVVLAGGAVNTFSAAINGVYKQIEIINISGTFFATVIG